MYTEFFGFQDKPFSVTPDPRMFFENRTYDEAYANLLYGIRERKGFLLLTGEVGTGKTTILRRLMDELTPTVRLVFFYNTTLTFEELLTFICDELQLKVNGSGQLGKITALNKLLLDQLSKGSTAALFIDEAQNLRDEVFENLRLLSNLETAREKLVQIVLAGQPELEAKLGKIELRQLKQRIFSHSRLGSLNGDEVSTFIDYRLKASGYRGNDLFPRSTVREIARYSKGIPRVINIICDNALLIAYAESRKTVAAEVIREVAQDLRLEEKNPSGGAKLQYFPSFSNGKLEHNGNHRGYQIDSVVSTNGMTPTGVIANGTVALARAAAPPPHSATECVTQDFMDAFTRALTEAMGPMAPLVIRDRLTLFGDSVSMSKDTVAKLIELVSPEILDDVLRFRFQTKVSALVEKLNRH
jgi:type II secretory pathway predicted ATPase ExeA